MNYARLNRSRFTKVTSLFLTAAMSFTLIPSLLGTQDVAAAPDGIGLKPLDYLMLGTSKMASPREPDTEGFKFWVGYLAQGHSREEVVMGFTRSTEFVNRCIDARVYPY